MRRRLRRALATGFVALAASLLANSPSVLAVGGDVVLRTDNSPNGYYYGLDGTGEDRFITEYFADDYNPFATVCGARVIELNQGSIPPPGILGGDLRREDPANPGYPDLGPTGLIAEVDPESTGPCDRLTLRRRIFTFGSGLGIAHPGIRHYLSAIEPLHGTGRLDFCGLVLDINETYGFSKTYASGRFERLPWNHFLELIVFVPRRIDLNIRAHGSARFPGDIGIPVVFASRANARGSLTDDAITLTLAIDNAIGAPISRNVEVCANWRYFRPGGGRLKSVTRFFRPVGGGDPIENPTTIRPGRTILRLEASTESLKERIASVVETRILTPLFRVLIDDPAFGTDPCLLETALDTDDETASLGLRRRAGSPDDDSAEAFYVVQAPNAEGDSLNVRMKALDLPRAVPFRVTGLEAVGGGFFDSGLPGLDAIELRSEDPVFSGSPDLSEQGLLRSFGTADGIGEVPFTSIGVTVVLDVPDLPVDPRLFTSNMYVRGLLLPGETMPVTAIGADEVPGDTLLGDSSTTTSGLQPAVTAHTSNFMLRLLLDGDRATLEGIAPPATVSKHAFLGRVGEFIAIDRRTGRPRP